MVMSELGGNARWELWRQRATCLMAGLLLLAPLSWAAGESDGPMALDDALELVRTHPDDPGALKELGYAYYETGRLEDALTTFLQVIGLNPDDAEAMVNVGIFYGNLNRQDEALDMFRRARRLAPEDPVVLCNEAMALYGLGKTEEALRGLLSALEIDPENQAAHFQLGVAFADARIFKEAIREWEAVIASDSTTAVAAQARANIRTAWGMHGR